MKKFTGFMAILTVGFFLIASGGSAAAATWWTTDSVTKNVKLIGIDPTSALITAAAPTTAPAFTNNLLTDLLVGSLVQFTLTGGAVFSALPPTLTGPNGVFALINGGNPGDTQVTFQVTTAVPTTDVSTLTSNYNVAGVASGSNVNIIMNIKAANGVTPIGVVDDALFNLGSRYLFANTGLAVLTVTDTAKTDTVDVGASSGPYTLFTGGAGTTGSMTVLDVVNATGPTAVPAATLFAINKVLVTLSGDFAGIASISAAGFTGSDATGTASGVVGQFLINTAKTKAYAVNTAALAGNTTTSLDPTFTLDGTTSQIARSFTAQVEMLVNAPFLARSYFDKTDYTILRNGVSFSANSIGPLNMIKITDRSGNLPALGAVVLVSAYDAAGAKLADAAGVQPILLLTNETIVKTGSELAARFVGTAMRYEVSIQTTAAICTNIKKDATGITETVFSENANAL